MKFEIWWIWMALATLFLMGEVLRLGSFFLWLSLGAALSGILDLLNIPAAGQVAVFINVSGILIVLERRFYERYTFKRPRQKELNSYQTEPLISSQPENEEVNIFRKSGPGWEIKYGGKSYTIKPSIGLFHIRNLIINKGEWIHCSDIKRMASEDLSEFKHEVYNNLTREQLDHENLRISEDILPEDIIHQLPLSKLKQLRDELYERKVTDNFNSPEEKIDQLHILDSIEKYLNSVTDDKGKSRKLYSEADTDRKAVSAALSRCRKSFQEHKELYTHFESFIHAESNSFRYLPDRHIDWLTG